MSSSAENVAVEQGQLATVSANFRDVSDRVKKASEIRGGRSVRLVAVSKTKPVELLKAVYDTGCRCFGENYVQELVDKVPVLPNDIQWHFIGALQSNKCNMLVKAMDGAIDRLTVETVSSIKLANKLNSAVESVVGSQQNISSDDGAGTCITSKMRLKVFVQVNTSAEDTKSGVEPGNETIELCRHLLDQCPFLDFQGLMTIGAVGDLSCFTTLMQCRSQVCEAIDMLQENEIEISMGMSSDFEAAIAAGSTNVRVGSTIFGERDYSRKT